MAFSKEKMQLELLEFMQGYTSSFQRLFKGRHDLLNCTQEFDSIKKSYLWEIMSDMYDFGVKGLLVPGLGSDLNISGHVDAELFFNCIAKGSMQMYLEEDDVIYPKKCIDTVRIAVARLVLEGGERDTDWGAYEDGESDFDCLTLTEIALLADMDERSVRNAAHPKANNPLKTERMGKRSVVSALEAKRWLSGRRGFTPTQTIENENKKLLSREISLPEDVFNSISNKAEKAGLSLADYIKANF